jgi:hypothetical protein
MTKKMRTFAVTVAAAGLILAAGAAQALPSISILWQANGTATIGTPTITGSSTIVADIVLTTDVATIIGVFLTIEFDASELQALSFKEITVNLPGMGNEFNPLLAGGTIDNVNGLVLNFDTQTLATGLAGGLTRTLGSVTFHVVSSVLPPADIDVIASLQNAGIDSFEASGGASLGGNFTGASVTGVPEPTTALLVIAGLAGLGYAGRRSLR